MHDKVSIAFLYALLKIRERILKPAFDKTDSLIVRFRSNSRRREMTFFQVSPILWQPLETIQTKKQTVLVHVFPCKVIDRISLPHSKFNERNWIVAFQNIGQAEIPKVFPRRECLAV